MPCMLILHLANSIILVDYNTARSTSLLVDNANAGPTLCTSARTTTRARGARVAGRATRKFVVGRHSDVCIAKAIASECVGGS